MKLSNRIIALLLVLAMAISMVACVTTEESNQTTETKSTPSTTQTAETTEAETTTDPHADPGVPTVNYDGMTYTMLGKADFASTTYGDQRDLVYIEDIETNSINEAVRDRNTYVSDTYGVTIKGNLVDDSIKEVVSNAEKGSLVICNILSTSFNNFAGLIDNGQVKDINSGMGSYLDLSQSWWNQDCRENMSIAHALYFMCGDILTTDKEAIWAVSFNRDIVNDLSLDNPYTLLDSYEWTYDKMYAMAKTASNASEHESSDYFGTRWGMVSDGSNNYFLWQGSGYQLIVKDSITDIPSMGALTEGAFDAMKSVATMQYDTQTTLFAASIKGVSDVYFEGTLKIFMDGNALFNVGSISLCEWMRDKETDFGILPMPMADEEQRHYYSTMSNSWTNAIGFQASLGKTNSGEIDNSVIDFTAIITQALACESTDTVLEAYYDKTLVYKGLRREEDEKALDIVFDNRLFDLSLVFDWASNLTSEIGTAKSEKKVNNLKNKYDQYAAGTQKAINNFLTKHGLV